MSAIAFIVKPVKPKVGFISTGVVSAIHFSFSEVDCLIGGDRPVLRQGGAVLLIQ